MNDPSIIDALKLERERVRASFDQAADQYDRAAGLQRRAAERLLVHVTGQEVDPVAILDAGCGTGYGARLLAAQFPEAQLYCLDIACSMLLRARTEEPQVPERPAYVCAAAEQLPLASGAIDLLWSSAMLQWCNDLPTVFAGFARVLAHDGLLALATFGPATLHELRTAFDDGYTHVSRFPDAQFIQEALQTSGFRDIAIERRSTVLHYPDVRALMRSLKTIGARNATTGRPRGLMGKAAWQRMCTRYEPLRQPQGLPATYELIYVTARKAPRATT